MAKLSLVASQVLVQTEYSCLGSCAATHHSLYFTTITTSANSYLDMLKPFLIIFTVLHGMQTRSSDENSVCPSVCLSNVCIVTKRKKELSRFLYHTKDELSFLRRMVDGGSDPFYMS